jgi:hypothetical protein
MRVPASPLPLVAFLAVQVPVVVLAVVFVVLVVPQDEEAVVPQDVD